MLDAHDAPVTAIALGTLGDREVVVTGDRAGAVRWWDPDSGELIDRAYGHVPGPVQGVGAGEAGDVPFVVALDDDGVLTAWDADTTDELGQISCLYRASHGPFLLPHRDRPAIVVADDQQVMAVDAVTGRFEDLGSVSARIGRPPRYEDATDGHDSAMSVFAAGLVNGWPCWVTGDIWGYHYLWEGGAVRCQLTGGPVVPSTALALGAAGGRSLIVRSDTADAVWVHDTTGAALTGPLTGCTGRIVAVGLAPDAIVAASLDGTVRRWSINDWDSRTATVPGEPAAMAVSPRTGRAWIAVGTTVVATD